MVSSTAVTLTRLTTVLFTAMGGCTSYAVLDVLLPLHAKNALGLNAADFSRFVSAQKMFLVPGIAVLPWLLRRMSSTLLCSAALVVYGICMPVMFQSRHAAGFLAVFVLHSVACEYVFVALNALTQAVNPVYPATPNTAYRLVRAGASVTAPWLTARLLASLGEAQLFHLLPLLMAGAMLACAALIRAFPLPEAVASRAGGAAAGAAKSGIDDHSVAGGIYGRLRSLVVSARDALGGPHGLRLVCVMQVLGTTWITIHTFVFFWVTEDLGHGVAFFTFLKSAAKLGGFGSITLVGVGMQRLGMRPTMLVCQLTSTACMALMALSHRWGVYGYCGMCMVTDAIPMISSIWVSRVALAPGGGGGGSRGSCDVTGRKASAFAVKKVVGRAINAVGLLLFGTVARFMGSKQMVFAACSAVSFFGTVCFAFFAPPPRGLPSPSESSESELKGNTNRNTKGSASVAREKTD